MEDSRTNPNQEIKLVFALKNQNLVELDRILMAVSTPGNPEYGNFKRPSDMQALIAPTERSIHNVLDWLSSTFDAVDVVRETFTADLLSVRTTVGVAERFLNCKYYDYVSTIDMQTRVSRVRLGTDYSVDIAVARDLYFVSPTVRFPHLKPRVQVSAVEQNPSLLRALYNVGNAKGSAAGNSQAVASFRNQLYDIADCQAMWKAYNIDSCTVTNNPADQASGHHLEAELDTQYMSSMGEGVPMQVWMTAGINFENALMEWTNNILLSAQNGTAPMLFSVSYGGAESQFGLPYVTKLNSQFALVGTAGVTIMFASGDSGAGGGCTTGPFEPDYPACSPYVTAVGGVSGGTAGKQPLGESAWNDGGGGFSNYAGQQSYQASAISYYLSNENNLPEKAKYNASGRGFPDIAAQSVDFLIYVNGRKEGVSGTSCSSPTSGGIFALLNDLRLQKGMKQLGFLNPFIYQTGAADATAFNDVTEGFNKGCGIGINKGFEAYAKWDPASGYGSPNYAVLATHVQRTGEQTKRWVRS
jgi:tripeptidyl-peptidase-1